MEDAVAQVIKMSDRWRRWYAGFEREEDESAAVSLEDLPKPVRERMAAVTAEVKKLEQTAQRYLKRN